MAINIIKPRIASLTGRTVPLPPKTASPHYLTPAHQHWSNQVRQRAGYICEQCGRSEGRMFADHIVELQDGGALFDVSNGQCLCGACHTRKTVGERAKRL
jgi:5-methylcytosine-specific restriction enzyme A